MNKLKLRLCNVAEMVKLKKKDLNNIRIFQNFIILRRNQISNLNSFLVQVFDGWTAEKQDFKVS